MLSLDSRASTSARPVPWEVFTCLWDTTGIIVRGWDTTHSALKIVESKQQLAFALRLITIGLAAISKAKLEFRL